MAEIIEQVASELTVFTGVLIALTNVIVQVLKQIVPDSKLSTNFLAVIVAVVVTVVGFFAYCELKSIPVYWYMVVGSVIYGVLIAYGAMFGFDKLKEAMGKKNG